MLRKPCTGHQSAHAVTNEQWRESCSCLNPGKRVIQNRNVTVDRRENGLEIHSNEGPVLARQALHPVIPKPTVATEAMHQYDAPASSNTFALQPIGDGPPAKGLLPAKHPKVMRRFSDPRAHQHWPAGQWHRIRPAHAAQKQEFEAENGNRKQKHRKTDDPSKPGMVRPKQSTRNCSDGHLAKKPQALEPSYKRL